MIVIRQYVLREANFAGQRRLDISLELSNGEEIVVPAIYPDKLRCVVGWRVERDGPTIYAIDQNTAAPLPNRPLMVGRVEQLVDPEQIPAMEYFYV